MLTTQTVIYATVTNTATGEKLFLGPVTQLEIPSFLNTYAVHPNQLCFDFEPTQRFLVLSHISDYSIDHIVSLTNNNLLLKF